MNFNEITRRLANLGFGSPFLAGLSERQQRKIFRRIMGRKRGESNYNPHQGAKECARRRQQIAYDAGLTDRRAYASPKEPAA